MTVEFTLEAANNKCLHCDVRMRPHASQKKACMGHPTREMGYPPRDPMKMNNENPETRNGHDKVSQHIRESLPAQFDLTQSLKFVPEVVTGPDGEAVMNWSLELESRLREDGAPTRQVELSYGRVRVDIGEFEGNRVVFTCRSATDKQYVGDLQLAGRRAALAVHRYVGRISKICGIDRSQWLGSVVAAYCSFGGPKDYDTTDLMRSAAKWSSAKVRSLIDLGMDLNAENMIGETALSYAVREGRIGVFEILTDAGARTDVSFEGHTLLHEAAVGGSVQVMNSLVQKGLEIDAVDWLGLTPIWYAVSHGRVKVAEYLMVEGADWRIEPFTLASSYPRMKQGFTLANQAELTLGADHQFTKMLRELSRTGGSLKP